MFYMRNICRICDQHGKKNSGKILQDLSSIWNISVSNLSAIKYTRDMQPGGINGIALMMVLH